MSRRGRVRRRRRPRRSGTARPPGRKLRWTAEDIVRIVRELGLNQEDKEFLFACAPHFARYAQTRFVVSAHRMRGILLFTPSVTAIWRNRGGLPTVFWVSFCLAGLGEDPLRGNSATRLAGIQEDGVFRDSAQKFALCLNDHRVTVSQCDIVLRQIVGLWRRSEARTEIVVNPSAH